MRKKAPVEFKGTLNGLFLSIDEAIEFETVLEQLDKILEQSAEFYKGSSIIGCKGMPLSYGQKYQLEQSIQKYGIVVDSLEEAMEVKKPVVPSAPEPQIVEREIVVEKEVLRSDTKFVIGTMRSGKGVEFEGNVVVLGDVNPGAEVVAGGNVVIIGKLLGFVHAGAYGDDSAFVVANVLAPTQIRISRCISVPPKDESLDQRIHAEKAFVSDGVIKIETVH